MPQLSPQSLTMLDNQSSPKPKTSRKRRFKTEREPPIRPPGADQSTVNSEKRPAKKRGVIEGTFHETIDVIVGPEKKRYEVHKSFLTTQSQLIKGKLGAKTKQLVLDEVKPRTFDCFLAYLYSRNICRDGQKYDSIDWDLLVDLYLVAEYLNVLGLQNQVIDALSTKVDACKDGLMPSRLLHTIFDNTPSASPIRRLAVDTYVWNLRVGDEDGKNEPFSVIGKGDLPSEFSVELLKGMIIRASKLRRNRIFVPVSGEYYIGKAKAQERGRGKGPAAAVTSGKS